MLIRTSGPARPQSAGNNEESTRADRLLSILLLLQARGRVTARELAERLDVSERTIHRDMDALSTAGVPVFVQRGAGGGWLLPEEYRTETAGLNEGEVRAVFLTNPPRLLADLGLDRAAEAALIKLLSALPADHRRDAEHVRARIHVDVSGWHRRDEAVPLLPAIQAAVLDERRLRIGYARAGGETVVREVDPLGLVAKGSIWYLIAGVESEFRTYRVSRVRETTVLDEPCRRPASFDLSAFWEASKAEFVERLPRYPVILSTEAAVIDALRSASRWSRVEAIEPPGPDGRSSVAMRFERFEDAVACLLGFGPDVEVREPLALRDEIRRRAAATVARYGGGDSSSVLCSAADGQAAGNRRPTSEERAGAMTNDAMMQPTSPPPPGDNPPSGDERIAAGLADLIRAADSLRDLDLEGIEPASTFDAAWDTEEEAG